jgi:hypothetical protein
LLEGLTQYPIVQECDERHKAVESITDEFLFYGMQPKAIRHGYGGWLGFTWDKFIDHASGFGYFYAYQIISAVSSLGLVISHDTIIS